ncbi:MAG: hypothetical protein BWY57_03378 [Betaproteobacteria bacterium ADurb.Bin341]|nr:MAG: hypothetical protein BWY57_03378 [Betaproteobacteria bacterium ADurb.Bin341]
MGRDLDKARIGRSAKVFRHQVDFARAGVEDQVVSVRIGGIVNRDGGSANGCDGRTNHLVRIHAHLHELDLCVAHTLVVAQLTHDRLEAVRAGILKGDIVVHVDGNLLRMNKVTPQFFIQNDRRHNVPSFFLY